MRLKCPNCGAEYEVDSAMIPDPGRDVQCAACGHGWFQDAEGAPGDGAVTLDALRSEHSGSAEASAPPVPEVAEDSDIDADEATAIPAPDTLLTPDRRSLDPNVRKILEEEAALERKARAADLRPLTSQPDLGLDDLEESDFKRGDVRKGDVAASLDDEVDLAPAATAALARPAKSAGERLPNVEEINSTLRSDTERDPRQEAAVVTRDVRQNKRGFRLGFSIMLIATTLAILAYIYSPLLAEQFPDMRDPLARYVDNVNQLRDGIDGVMDRVSDWLRQLL